jgi:hypothetical protein
LFLRVTLEKTFPQRVVIDANGIDEFLQQQRLPGFVEQLIRRITPDYGPQVKTGIESFDRCFRVFGSDEQVVQNLLTPDFVDQLVSIRESMEPKNDDASGSTRRLAAPFRFSLALQGNALFFALHQESLFPFDSFRSEVDSQDLLTGSIERIVMMIDLAKAC